MKKRFCGGEYTESITWKCEKFTEEQKKQIENIPNVSSVKYECGRVQVFLRTPLNATDADKNQIRNNVFNRVASIIQ